MASLQLSTGWLAGYVADLPTPFDASGEVDVSAFIRLCERQIKATVGAIVVGETTGEASTLTDAERNTLIRAAVAAARGRARVIAGAGSNATGRAIELAKLAEAAGADAVLSVVPYYNKPMQSGIEAHFRSVAGSTALPIVLHDVPSRCARELADDTLLRLADDGRFIGLRDGTGDISRIARLRPRLPTGFRLLSGDDATAPAFFAAGGDGAISLVSNVAPDLCQAVLANSRQGRRQSARYLHGRLVPLAACLAKDGPAALKYALSQLGLINPDLRLPLVEIDVAAKADIARALMSIVDEDLVEAAEA